ncbi:MAG: Wzz/FepE/Etk N-terminal domain-containing protein, partial [Gaiellaceae bacterium]
MGDEVVGRGPGRRTDGGEQPLELRRYLDALRRARWGLLAFAVLATAAAVGISTALPKSYTATARILYDPSSGLLSGQSSDVIQRQLATYGSLAVAPRVLDRVASTLGTTGRRLQRKVSVAEDQTANLLDVAATAGTPGRAQAIAGAVARTFLTQERHDDLVQLQAAAAKLRAQLAGIRGAPSTATQAQAIQS